MLSFLILFFYNSLYDSNSFEETIRLVVSLGGDVDTMGVIAGAITEAFYRDAPEYIVEQVLRWLPDEFADVLGRFYDRFVRQ